MSVIEAYSSPNTSVSIVLAQYTLATSAGVTIASGDFTVGAGGTTTIGGALDIRDSGYANHTSGYTRVIITITAHPNATYFPVVTPSFNPQTYGGLWIASRSATAFEVQTGSASNNVSSLNLYWMITR